MEINEISSSLREINREETEDKLIIYAESKSKEFICPECNKVSKSIHSKNSRIFQDLPQKGKPVYIHLETKIFKCLNKECNTSRFSEIYDFIGLNEKVSKRLKEHLLKLLETNSVRKTCSILNDEGVDIKKTSVNAIQLREKENK